MRAQDMTDTETQALRETLLANTVKELNTLARRVSVRLAGSSRKADIVERVLAMVMMDYCICQRSITTMHKFREKWLC